jgi:hypothetical protein
MTESVTFDNCVYDPPLVYGNECTIILQEENIHCSEVSNFRTRSVRGWDLKKKAIRVILGRFGQIYKMSAPKKDIITEGQSPDEAWAKFLVEISKREDSASLSFDVGPTRRDEITEGLNIPEDEDWSELLSKPEDD